MDPIKTGRRTELACRWPWARPVQATSCRSVRSSHSLRPSDASARSAPSTRPQSYHGRPTRARRTSATAAAKSPRTSCALTRTRLSGSPARRRRWRRACCALRLNSVRRALLHEKSTVHAQYFSFATASLHSAPVRASRSASRRPQTEHGICPNRRGRKFSRGSSASVEMPIWTCA